MLHHSPFPPLPPLPFTCLPFLISPAPHYTLPPPPRPPSLASWLMICQVKVRHLVWRRGHVVLSSVCVVVLCVFSYSFSLYIYLCVCVCLGMVLLHCCSAWFLPALTVTGGWSRTRCVGVHVCIGNLKNKSNNYTSKCSLIYHQNLHNSPPKCKCISCFLSGIVLKTIYTVQMWCDVCVYLCVSEAEVWLSDSKLYPCRVSQANVGLTFKLGWQSGCKRPRAAAYSRHSAKCTNL